jgi:hypothetical protein
MFCRLRPYKKRSAFWEISLVAVVSWCLFWMGAWVWIDNRWAVIPGFTEAGQAGLLGVVTGGALQVKAPAGDTKTDLPVGLVEGNGDGDDNKEEPFVPFPFVANLAQVQVLLKNPARVNRPQVISYQDLGHLKVNPAKFSARFDHRRLTSYKDFGHLKVGPPARPLQLSTAKYRLQLQGRRN